MAINSDGTPDRALPVLVRYYEKNRPNDLLEADDMADEWSGQPGAVPAHVVRMAWDIYSGEREIGN